MPRPAKELGADPWLKLLVMGVAKVGKTRCVVSTSPDEGRYVIECDNEDALIPARRVTDAFEWDLVAPRRSPWAQMEAYMKFASDGVKEGKYKTVIIDGLSTLSHRITDECLAVTDKGNGPDGRRAYPAAEKRMLHIIDFFMTLPCHFIVTSNWMDKGGEEIEGQAPKVGEGIVPLLVGGQKMSIPARLNNICVMEFDRVTKERVFTISPQGVWGPGFRSLEGVEKLPADITRIIAKVHDYNNIKNTNAPKTNATNATNVKKKG